MKKIKTYAGYICLKPINGIIFPSYAQNKTNKEFINNVLKGEFFISTNENMYSKNNIVLNSLIKEKNKISGIVMHSAFSLPQTFDERSIIYKNLIKHKKTIHFVFENFYFKSKKDIEIIENYLIFRNQFFTEIKKNLSNYEKKLYLDNNWSFV